MSFSTIEDKGRNSWSGFRPFDMNWFPPIGERRLPSAEVAFLLTINRNVFSKLKQMPGKGVK